MQTDAPNEKCPDCGAPVNIACGLDIRFTSPDRRLMYRAECGGNCVNPSLEWTRFTRAEALDSWNRGVIAHRAAAAIAPQAGAAKGGAS